VFSVGTHAAWAQPADWVLLAGVSPSANHRGVATEIRDELRAERRNAIRARLRTAAAALRSGRRTPRGGAAPVQFGWPLSAPRLDVWGFHGVSSFVDHDAAFPDQVLDYACGGRAYDTAAGYNHRGTDFFLWPFAWNRMDAEDVQVVAAADGTIIDIDDGNPDRSCAFNDMPWNAVYIEHGDGSMAWYGHLKRGSPTHKGIGSAVVRGEYLGLVGSSGNSTGPHLHLEVYDADDQLIDPYEGPCNPLSPVSWWLEQRPYYDSAINEITTGNLPPIILQCDPSTSNRQDVVVRGSVVYFTSYYRDHLTGQVSQHAIYRPDGSTYSSWSHANPDPFYPASYWYWSFEQFAVADQPGTWRYEIVFEGKTYVHEFGVVASAAEVPTSTPTSAPGATPTPLACAGDCDGDGVISIAELIRAVGIALGTVPLDACVAADPLSDGRVTIAELVRCVGSAIGNCRGA
jgi:murein DD-endopeptidase MepM/ murein hydrolase activator NlpD